ncbi:MAG: pseudouridine synthase [Spirochaetota bacterium]|nr:pseudouridine synthase [Spirochaetota bacterium]
MSSQNIQLRNEGKRVRINKYLSLCGLGSRRKVEDYILKGRIKKNNKVVNDLSTTVDIHNDVIELDKKRLLPINELFYIILNKPKGYITTIKDERGRPIVMDLIPEKYKKAGVCPVGRLDKDTEGLLFMTNDGDFAYQLSHPKHGLIREYIVVLDKPLLDSHKSEIEKGIFIDKEKTNPMRIITLNESHMSVKVLLNEGKKRQIRIAFSSFGYKIRKLKRTAFGSLRIDGVKSGSIRIVKNREVKALRQSILKRHS